MSKSHPLYHLGKKKAERDKRSLKLTEIVAPKISVPEEYNFDLEKPGTPMPMFANDTLGCCVISGRAHQTLRFEFVEQKKLITITDKDVVREYFRETGGPDSGLIVLRSLKAWRNKGWLIGRKKYWIQAFAEIRLGDKTQLQQAVYLDVGAGLGLNLPLSAQKQLDAGKPWTVASGPGTAAGGWGGHYVYVSGYTKDGPVCITWGQKQAMTWQFYRKYCDEAYAVIDAVNTAKKRRFIVAKAIQDYLALHDSKRKPSIEADQSEK